MAIDQRTLEALAKAPSGKFSAERNSNYPKSPDLSGAVLRYDPGPCSLKFVALAITDSVADADNIADRLALELNTVGDLAREVLHLRRQRDELQEANTRLHYKLTDRDEELAAALLDAYRAVDFFDRVKAASEAEKTAVGHDHWAWLEQAARGVAKLAVTPAPRS